MEENKKKFWTYLIISETEKPEEVEKLLTEQMKKDGSKIHLYRADPNASLGEAMNYLFPFSRSDSAIYQMEQDIRDSLKVVCPYPRFQHNYIQGYLEGRLNAILIIEQKLLGKQIDWNREP